MIAILSTTNYLFFDLASEGESYTSPNNYDVVLINQITNQTFTVSNITPSVANERYFKLDISTLDSTAPDGYYNLYVNVNGGASLYSEIAMILKTTSVNITENTITPTYAVNQI